MPAIETIDALFHHCSQLPDVIFASATRRRHQILCLFITARCRFRRLSPSLSATRNADIALKSFSPRRQDGNSCGHLQLSNPFTRKSHTRRTVVTSCPLRQPYPIRCISDSSSVLHILFHCTSGVTTSPADPAIRGVRVWGPRANPQHLFITTSLVSC